MRDRRGETGDVRQEQDIGTRCNIVLGEKFLKIRLSCLIFLMARIFSPNMWRGSAKIKWRGAAKNFAPKTAQWPKVAHVGVARTKKSGARPALQIGSTHV